MFKLGAKTSAGHLVSTQPYNTVFTRFNAAALFKFLVRQMRRSFGGDARTSKYGIVAAHLNYSIIIGNVSCLGH